MRSPASNLLILIVSSVSICLAQASPLTSIPKFSDYRVNQVYKGKNATPRITDSWRDVRTLIRDESRKPPNFAGSYRFVSWGCGTDCRSSLVINVKTGDIYDPEFGAISLDNYPTWIGKGFEFHSNSRLLVFDGCLQECGIYYYEWKGGDFHLLRIITQHPKD